MNCAVLFPGQGSQYVGMGRSLYEQSESARRVFAEADDTLGWRLSTLCFEGPEGELGDTANSQPAIFVTALSAWAALTECLGERVNPAAFAGHSLGEYSALVAAHALEFAPALRLVRARGLAMRNAGIVSPGGMTAVMGVDTPVVMELCSAVMKTTGLIVEVANDNCPGQVVVAGQSDGLGVFEQMCAERGFMPPRRLNVSVAPHTSLMKTALPAFLEQLEATPISAPEVPVVGNTSADWLTTAELVRADLASQLTHSVRWTESMRCLIGSGIGAVLDTGPGRVLSGLMRRIDPGVERRNLQADPAQLENCAQCFVKGME